MRRYFTETPLGPEGSTTKLSAKVSHHLLRVSLAPRGSEVLVFDSSGQEALAVLDGVDGQQALLRLTEPPRVRPKAQAKMLLMGQAKKQALDHTLRMATELGCSAIRIFEAHHSVAKGCHTERWKRLVEGCLAQCGRTTPPALSHHLSLEAALVDLPEGNRWVCHPDAPVTPNRPSGAVLLVGPEGGLSPQELQTSEESGFLRLGLGDLVLRCDTAAAAGLSLLH